MQLHGREHVHIRLLLSAFLLHPTTCKATGMRLCSLGTSHQGQHSLQQRQEQTPCYGHYLALLWDMHNSFLCKSLLDYHHWPLCMAMWFINHCFVLSAYIGMHASPNYWITVYTIMDVSQPAVVWLTNVGLAGIGSIGVRNASICTDFLRTTVSYLPGTDHS